MCSVWGTLYLFMGTCMFYLRYEGTGRSLSLKLIQQLRQQNATFGTNGKTKSGNSHNDAGSSATGNIQEVQKPFHWCMTIEMRVGLKQVQQFGNAEQECR